MSCVLRGFASFNQPAGLYIHIPFCRRKCPYCDFYSITDFALKPAFVAALCTEMSLRADGRLEFDSLYVGGGTPSVLATDELIRILERAHRYFRIRPDAEQTLEINPGAVTAEQLSAWRRAGINRLSIGVQSFQQRRLDFLGRIHTAADARRTYRQARRAGFDNISLDLIYGLPGQDRADWRQDLHGAAELQPEHLSCYILSCEPGTPLHRQVQQGKIQLPSDAVLRDLFVFTGDFLQARGWPRYEVSNFARRRGRAGRDRRSRHNRKYWSRAPYIGCGPAAHSFLEPRRWWNLRGVAEYATALQAGRLPAAGEEHLTPEQRMLEVIYLGLRTGDGVDLQAFERDFGLDFRQVCRDPLAVLRADGLLELTADRCRLTRKGLALHESVAAMLTGQ